MRLRIGGTVVSLERRQVSLFAVLFLVALVTFYRTFLWVWSAPSRRDGDRQEPIPFDDRVKLEPVPLEDVIRHQRAVRRGTEQASDDVVNRQKVMKQGAERGSNDVVNRSRAAKLRAAQEYDDVEDLFGDVRKLERVGEVTKRRVTVKSTDGGGGAKVVRDSVKSDGVAATRRGSVKHDEVIKMAMDDARQERGTAIFKSLSKLIASQKRAPDSR